MVSILVEIWITNRLNDDDNNSQSDDKYISMILGVRPDTIMDEIINLYFNHMAYKFGIYTNRVWDTTNLKAYHLLNEFLHTSISSYLHIFFSSYHYLYVPYTHNTV